MFGALTVIGMGAAFWHMIDEVRVDLVVYLPAEGSEAGDTWVSSLRDAGFHVHVEEEADPISRRTLLHVPERFAAEVTAVTANSRDYVISGFVPPTAIRRVLREQRAYDGLMVVGTGTSLGKELPESGTEIWGFWSDGHKEFYARIPARQTSH